MTPWELIWTGRSQELAALEDLDPSDWVGATQADVRRYLLQSTSLRQAVAVGAAVFEACVVMMAKDEADIIGINLRWLYRLGLRRFVVLDNKSSDETGNVLRLMREALTDCELVIVDDPTIRYTQSDKTTGLMRLAECFWPDVRWIFPIDADEVLCVQDGLAELRKVPDEVDAIVLQKVNHYLGELPASHADGEVELDRMQLRTHLGSQPPKIALRRDQAAIIVQGNHDIKAKTERRVIYAPGLSFGFYYREFQFRSFEQFKKKIVNGGRALLAAERETGRSFGGDHWKSWFMAYEERGDDGLYAVFQSVAIRTPADLVRDPLTLS